MAYAYKDDKKAEEPQPVERIRIILTKALEKVCEKLIHGAREEHLAVKGPIRMPSKVLCITVRNTPCGEGSKTWDRFQHLRHVCSWLGMKRVGWIFNDLWSESRTLGTVKCIRNEDSFLLSASECITAGNLQSHFKNATNYCDTGYFGSRFVTVVASGNSSKGIDLHGYQVSNQCTAMVEANILCPTKTHPELAWARETPLNKRIILLLFNIRRKMKEAKKFFVMEGLCLLNIYLLMCRVGFEKCQIIHFLVAILSVSIWRIWTRVFILGGFLSGGESWQNLRFIVDINFYIFLF
ncbi:unnamed protein product [Meloidogyne enterolobii]|uniref:Uncharacterized protein n=1 Tax=Meloidogyne enterolobii TaxID=390850 RepID=A0ACB0YUH4_MELEN